MGTLERILRTQAAGGKAIGGNRFFYGDGPSSVYIPGQNNFCKSTQRRLLDPEGTTIPIETDTADSAAPSENAQAEA